MPSSSSCSGDLDRLVAVTMPAILPISVALPVAVTTTRRRAAGDLGVLEHQVGAVAQRHLALGQRPASLGIGALSPVSAASCTSSVAEDAIRPSAGTTSPASSSTMSPGTSVVDSISATWPERRTRACGTCSLASASTLARAFSSWFVPITTLNSHQAQHHQGGGDLDDREAGRDHDQQHDVHRVHQLVPRAPPICSAAARSVARSARTPPAAVPPPWPSARRPGRRPAAPSRPAATARTR